MRRSLASEYNISLILKFINERKVMKVWKSDQTVRNYIFNLHNFAEFLKQRKFEDVDKDIAIEYVGYLTRKISNRTNRELKGITIEVAKARMMSFYRWLNNGERPDFLKDFKVNLKPISVKMDQILSIEEVKRMVEIADNVRDKATVAFLYESGCRIGEFLNLRIKDVKFDKFGALVSLSGKTGDREIRIVDSLPYIKNMMRYRSSNKEDDWLWISKYEKETMKLDYMSISHMLKNLGVRAGIKKNTRPHIFRHSRATHLVPKLPESAMRIYFGWSPGSDMPKMYIHLSGKDVDNIVLSKVYGIKSEKDEREIAMSPKTCPNCEASNSADSDFCSNCKWALDNNSISRPEKEYWKTVTLEKLEKLVDEKLEEIVIRRMGNS